MIVQRLNHWMSQDYVAEPRVHLGSMMKVDIGTFDEDHVRASGVGPTSDDGGVAVAAWAPARPTLTIVTNPPALYEYAVKVYDMSEGRRLVAVVEFVSRANKDRPEHRRAFVAKCAGFLREGVCVAIVDVVTTRSFNLYGDLMDFLGQADPSLANAPLAIYATACRWASNETSWTLEAWAYPLALGQPLPTLPLWLTEDLAVPLDLERSYEETCRILRIGQG